MIFDSLLNFSGGVSAAGAFSGQLANGAGNVIGSNAADFASLPLGGNQLGDYGAGADFYVTFTVLSAPTVGTSVRFQIIQADDPALTLNVQVINQTDDIPIASLSAGTLIPLGWDPATPFSPKRYVGVRYVNTGAIATFSVFAAVTHDVQALKTLNFKSGYSVV